MKITVVSAAGKSGSLIVKEALARNHSVTAIVRKDSDKAKIPAGAKVIVKDLMDLSSTDLKDADVVIDAFGTWAPETLVQHKTTLRFLADLLAGKSTRLLVVGGAGSLYVDSELRTRVMDLPTFPEGWKALASTMGEAFAELKKRNDVNWTYVSPSANFDAAGIRTGKYQIGTEQLLANAAGNSEISYADYAIAMIDESEKASFVQTRITVCSK
jgi:Putative NADH-flavin reductase